MTYKQVYTNKYNIFSTCPGFAAAPASVLSPIFKAAEAFAYTVPAGIICSSNLLTLDSMFRLLQLLAFAKA